METQDIFREVVDVLESHRVFFWLDQGALLGAVRDGGFLPWDSDIDLSVWADETNDLEKVLRDLEDRRYEVRFEGNADAITSDFVSIIPPDGLRVTLQRHRISGSMAMRRHLVGRALHRPGYRILKAASAAFDPRRREGSSRRILRSIAALLPDDAALAASRWLYVFAGSVLEKRYREVHICEMPIRLLSEFSTVEIVGREVPVPHPVEDYLAYKYGEDWRTPRKEWVFWRDERAVRPTGEHLPDWPWTKSVRERFNAAANGAKDARG